MPGWKIALSTPPQVRQSPDGGEKTTTIPAVAGPGAPWLPETIEKMRQLFMADAKRLAPNLTNVQWSANNGAGDVAGVGTVTITITTS